jgi:hypothetical protein
MHTANMKEDMKFNIDTNNFNLIVVLDGDRLTVTIKDYQDWVIYSKEYTEDDVSGDIHKKMDLFDIYTSFCLTKICN